MAIDGTVFDVPDSETNAEGIKIMMRSLITTVLTTSARKQKAKDREQKSQVNILSCLLVSFVLLVPFFAQTTQAQSEVKFICSDGFDRTK
jgi:hydrogenase-4 membrane subunit HyfE